MTITDLRSAVAIPAGWYPDPVDASGMRWWSGENWTEHTSAPSPPAERVPLAYEPVALEPIAQEPVAQEPVIRRRAPRRDRNVISGIALIFAVLGLLAFVGGQLLDVPDLILYIAGAAPFTVAALAIVVAIRTHRGLAVAVVAAVLCIVNVAMVAALSATEARQDLGTALENPSTFEHILEQSVVDTTNTLVMPGLAVSADCPDVPTPAIGTVTECTVTLDNGDSYLVQVTSKDGLGGMTFDISDSPIPAGTAPAEG